MEESGASPAEERGHRGEVTQRPQESELGTAGPPSSPEEDPREAPVGTAVAPDQVTFQRNRFRLPPPAVRGGCWGWRAASGLRRATLTDGCVCFRAAVITMGGPRVSERTPPPPPPELLKTFNAQNSANYGEDEVGVSELLSAIKIRSAACWKRTTAIDEGDT